MSGLVSGYSICFPINQTEKSATPNKDFQITASDPVAG